MKVKAFERFFSICFF